MTEQSTDSQNSRLRSLTQGVRGGIVDQLHHAFPRLTPDQITVLGVVGSSLTALAARLDASSSDRVSWAKRTGYFLGDAAWILTDALDGELARRHGAELGHDSGRGALVDSVSDRANDATHAAVRMLGAAGRNDRGGVVLALLAGLSNLTPSIARAMAEQYTTVPETGGNPLSFFGTRTGRTALTLAATHVPTVAGRSVQAPLDAVQVVANVSSTVERLRIYHGAEKNSPPHEKATRRLRVLSQTSVVAAVGLIGLGGVLLARGGKNRK